MRGLRAGMIAVLTLATASIAPAQERFLFDNLSYTTGTPVGPVTFSESQFPANQVIDGTALTKLNLADLPATLHFSFTVYGMKSKDAAVEDWSFYNGIFTNLFDDMVEGTTAGVLAIDFGTTVSQASFDFALLSFDLMDIVPGCTLTAFDANGNQVGQVAADAPVSIDSFFPEGTASFQSTAGFRRIEVKFASSFADRIPTLDAWGMALLAMVLGALGIILLRRTAA